MKIETVALDQIAGADVD